MEVQAAEICRTKPYVVARVALNRSGVARRERGRLSVKLVAGAGFVLSLQCTEAPD